MRKWLMIVWLPLCVMLSCKNSDRIPGDILQPERMGKVLFALNMAEEFVSLYVAKDSARNKEQELEKEYQKVFLLYQVTKDEFEKSYEFYKKHPDIFKVMLDTLDARGQRRRIDLYQPAD